MRPRFDWGRGAPRAGVRRRDALVMRLTAIVVAGAMTALLAAAPALALAPPALSVTGASLIVTNTGQQIYGLNANAELPIASTTKLMTALITLQHVHDLGVVFTQNDWVAAPEDSQIGLEPGERMSVHDLLLALLLPSADDAAEDLAYNVGGGSVHRFIAMMNAEARALHLTRTHYTTPTGLDTPGNYSSPTDLVRLAAYDLAHSAFFRRVVDLSHAELRSGNYPRYVVNTDDLVGRIPWINGVKTGHTDDAGYVLVSSGTRDGMTLIGSVLGTTSEAARDANALALLNWGFQNFHLVSPVRTGDVMTRVVVHDSPGTRAALLADTSFKRVVPRIDRVTVTVIAPKQLAGPLPRHAVVGQADVRVDGRVVSRIPLLLARTLPAISPVTQAARFLTRGTTLMWIAFVIGAACLGIAARKRWPRALAAGHMEER